MFMVSSTVPFGGLHIVDCYPGTMLLHYYTKTVRVVCIYIQQPNNVHQKVVKKPHWMSENRSV